MHATRTPLRTWFWAAYLVATHDPGISAKQLQRQLGLSRYETAWLILQKLRRAMIAPERGLLTGEVEIDEFFLGRHEDGLKSGRQHGKKALIGAVIEVRGQGSERQRLKVLPNSQAATLQAFATATTAPGAIVHTDGLLSYKGLPKLGYQHRPRKRPRRRAPAPAGASRDLQPQGLDARHPPRRLSSDEHRPLYLDEYVFSHNRRGTPMAAFQTLLRVSALHDPTTYAQITDHNPAA
jgi:hypothetical protein